MAIWLATFSFPVATASQLSAVKKALDSLVGKQLLDRDNSVRRNIPYYNYDLIRVIQND